MIGPTFKKDSVTHVQLVTDPAGKIERMVTEEQLDVTRAIEGVHFGFVR
jgi:hypothetical protein